MAMPDRNVMTWDAQMADRLEGPDRERDMSADAVADLLDLTGNETVLDYGAGTGRLTVAVARRLGPQGRVVAIENNREMFERLSSRLADTPNAQPLLIEGGPVPIPGAQADRILAVDVLHHVRADTLREMRRLLAPDGLLLLIDWDPAAPPREKGPPQHVLLTADEAIEELADAGLTAQRVNAPFADRYILRCTAIPGHEA